MLDENLETFGSEENRGEGGPEERQWIHRSSSTYVSYAFACLFLSGLGLARRAAFDPQLTERLKFTRVPPWAPKRKPLNGAWPEFPNDEEKELPKRYPFAVEVSKAGPLSSPPVNRMNRHRSFQENCPNGQKEQRKGNVV